MTEKPPRDPPRTPEQGVVHLDPAEVAARLHAGEITLVDVREADEFAAERIEGAVNVPLSALDPHGLRERVGDDRPMVFQCVVGGRSGRAAAACITAGWTRAEHLAGGLDAWKAAGLPTVKG